LLRDYDLAGVEVILAPGMARGIAYYSGLIFELFALPAEQQSEPAAPICGGGRYDGLVQTLTGRAIPALGFAFDVERLLDALPANVPAVPHAPRVAVFVGDPSLRADAQQTAAAVRARGITCRVHESDAGRDAAIVWARSEGFDCLIFVDPDRQGDIVARCMVILEEDARESLVAPLRQALDAAMHEEAALPTAMTGGER